MKLGRSFNDASLSSKTPQQERYGQWWSMECWTGFHLCCVGAEWRCFNLGRGRWFEFHSIHFSFEDLSKTSFWFTIYIYNKHQYMIGIMIILFLFHFSHFQNPFFFFETYHGMISNFWLSTSAFFSFKRHFSFENSPIITQKRHRCAVPAVPWHLAWKDLGIFF